MGTGRPKVVLNLTSEERTRLESLAHRTRSAPHVARRARIILACGDGLDSKVVARRLLVVSNRPRRTGPRFIVQAVESIADEAAAPLTRRRRCQVEQVIIRTLETTPRGATHWSTRDMAKALDLSRMAVNRVWRAFGLQPRIGARHSSCRKIRCSWSKYATSWGCT